MASPALIVGGAFFFREQGEKEKGEKETAVPILNWKYNLLHRIFSIVRKIRNVLQVDVLQVEFLPPFV